MSIALPNENFEATPHHVDTAIRQRIFKTPDAAYEPVGWLARKVPVATVQRMIDYANQFGLAFEESQADIRPAPADKEHKRWLILTKWSGIERIARASGLWLPGKVSYTRTPDDIVVHATCYVRSSTESNVWLEVGEFATASSYGERDLSGDDLRKIEPKGDWAIVPEIKLAEVARWKAAASGLGTLITQHEYEYATPMRLVHAEMITSRNRQS